MSKIDEKGKLVRIANDGLVKLDGIAILRKVEREGKLYLQFCDSDRMRSQLRKTRYVEIPADILLGIIRGDNADEHVQHHPME